MNTSELYSIVTVSEVVFRVVHIMFDSSKIILC
jgi:hypothetical protein